MALSIEQFDANNIVFEDVKKVSFGNIAYQRIPIKYLGADGKCDLCLATPELMSWGVQENRQKAKPTAPGEIPVELPVDSYSLPLVVENQAVVDAFEEILTKCQEYLSLASTQTSVGRKLTAHAEEMDIFYRKKDGNIPVAGAAPTMYPKLFTVYEKFRGTSPPTISTLFYDTNDEEIDPTTLLGVRCKVIAAVIVKDIYIGAKPSIQLKVNDVTVVEKMQKQKRLLSSMRQVKPVSVFQQNFQTETVSEDKEPTIEPQKTKFVMRKKPKDESTSEDVNEETVANPEPQKKFVMRKRQD
jgi:Protein of unknown function (DUF2738)